MDKDIETKTSEKAEVAEPQHISEVDRMVIENARLRMQLKAAEARTAAAVHETASINYQFTMVQIYYKYGLSQKDVITDLGEIVRGDQ